MSSSSEAEHTSSEDEEEITIAFICAGCDDGIIKGSREHGGRRELGGKFYCIDCVSKGIKELDALEIECILSP